MRHPACPPIRLAIKALDQKDLLRRETRSVIPPMALIILDAGRLALAVRVDEPTRHKVRVRHRVGVSNCQRIALNRLDGPPDIDDLHAALEKLVCLVGQMVRHAGQRRFVALVDVDLLDGAAEGRLVCCSDGAAADGVVKDEDAVSSGSILGLAGCYWSWRQLVFVERGQ